MKTVGDNRIAAVSEAKKVLQEYPKCDRTTVLLRHNEPVAALVTIERYNDILALEKLMRHPGLLDRLRKQAKAARATPLKMLRSLEDFEAGVRPSEDAPANPGPTTRRTGRTAAGSR